MKMPLRVDHVEPPLNITKVTLGSKVPKVCVRDADNETVSLVDLVSALNTAEDERRKLESDIRNLVWIVQGSRASNDLVTHAKVRGCSDSQIDEIRELARRYRFPVRG